MVPRSDGTLYLAQAGEVLVVMRPAPDQSIALDSDLYSLFDLRAVAGQWEALQRAGDTLRIVFADGGTVELVDFFDTGSPGDKLVQIDDTTYFTPDSLPLAYVVVDEHRAAGSSTAAEGAYFVRAPEPEPLDDPLGLAFVAGTEFGLVPDDPPPDFFADEDLFTIDDDDPPPPEPAPSPAPPANNPPELAQPIPDESSAEDTALSFTILAGTFTDPDGDPLTYSATLSNGDPLPLWLAFDPATQTFTGTPPQDFNGDLSITVTADDGTATASDTFVLDIAPVNDPPAVRDETNTTDEDTPLDVPAVGLLSPAPVDVDGDPLTLTQFTVAGDATIYAAGTTAVIAGVGSVTINADGSYSFIPEPDFHGPVPVATYTVSDGTLTDEGVLTLTVDPINDAPVAAPVDLGTVAEDGSRIITEAELLAGVTDVDGPVLDITDFSLTSGNGSLVDNMDGTWTYTPAQDDDTEVTFNYIASDGTDSASSTASLDITPVNDSPVASPVVLASIAEDSGARIITEAELLAGVTDVDGPVLDITAFTLTSGNGSLVDNGDDTWTYTPALDDDTAAAFSYTVSDGTASASSTASLDITPINDSPVASPVVLASIAEDSGARIITEAELLAGVTDVDGPALDITAFTLTSGNGSLVDNGDGTWSYTPAQDDDGAATFGYTASDGTASASSTASLDITPVNDAPVADDEIDATDEDTPLNVAAAGILIGDVDPDFDTLTVTQFTVAGDPLIYAAGDTAVLAGIGSLTINANGSYSFVPVLDFNGAVPVATYTVSDGTLTDEGTLTLTVNPINDAPVAAPDDNAGDQVVEAGVNPGNTLFVGDPSATGNVLANDTDVDAGDILTIAEINREVTAVGQVFVSAHGTFALAANGTWTYLLDNDDPEIDALAQGASADETFEYTVSDGAGGTATAILTITITGTNDAPIAVADDNDGDNVTRGTPGDITATGNVLTNDFDVDTGDTKTVIEVNGSAANVGQQIVGIYGALTLAANGTWTYLLDEADPDTLLLAATDSAVDSFSYTMTDANGATSSATLNVTVTGGDDPPYINTSSIHRFATPSQVGDIVFINGFSYQDIDSVGDVTVTIASSDPADILSADPGGGVTVAGSGSSTVTLTGTIAAINAYVSANNVRWDPALGNFDRNFTFTIDDNGALPGGMVVTKAVLFQHVPLNFNAFSADHPNLAGWNINSDDVHLGLFLGNDSVVTAWSHGPSTNDVEYDGGFAGSDTITLVFTPAQLEAILGDPASRGELQDYLDGDVGSGGAANTALSLGNTPWNATATGFENASLALATGPEGFATFGAIGANLPDFIAIPTAGDDTVVGTVAADTISGLDGNDILVGLDGDDTLNGGAGADMLLGGAGADTLAGGVGNDILSGGIGADRFVLAETGAADGATIVDYSFVDGDTLDLSSLLDAAFDVGEPVSDFVRGVQSGSNILIQVDVDGGGDSFADVATLTGYGTSSPDIVRVTFEGVDQVLLV
jgi:VCBS repeat-containing protein